jgi:hypothetical protein
MLGRGAHTQSLCDAFCVGLVGEARAFERARLPKYRPFALLTQGFDLPSPHPWAIAQSCRYASQHMLQEKPPPQSQPSGIPPRLLFADPSALTTHSQMKSVRAIILGLLAAVASAQEASTVSRKPPLPPPCSLPSRFLPLEAYSCLTRTFMGIQGLRATSVVAEVSLAFTK